MEHAEAVQRMQDYIAENLSNTITLADLSKVSLFSPWYSYRLFMQQLGITPADYIRRLRLSKSALRLRDEPTKIIDIALELGFGCTDSYQRAFFREFGCNPKDYAKNPVPIPLFVPYGVKYRTPQKEKIMKEIKNVFVQTIAKPARKAIIKRGIKAADYFAYCEEVGCDVWGLLKSIKSISGEPVCLWLPSKYIVDGTSEYVQGVEVPFTYADVIPDGFDVIELPAANYLMFKGEPFEEEEYCTAIEELQTAISKYDPAIIKAEWDGENPRIQLEPIGTRGYIELLPIK